MRLTVASLVVLAACGGDSAAPPMIDAPPPPAEIAVAVTPDPVQEEPCGGCGPITGQLWAVATLTIYESAGTGATVRSVGVRLVTGGTNVIAQGSFDAAAVQALAGSNRVPGGGTLTIPEVGPHYDDADGHQAAVLELDIDIVDDGGRPIPWSGSVSVLPAP